MTAPWPLVRDTYRNGWFPQCCERRIRPTDRKGGYRTPLRAAVALRGHLAAEHGMTVPLDRIPVAVLRGGILVELGLEVASRDQRNRSAS